MVQSKTDHEIFDTKDENDSEIRFGSRALTIISASFLPLANVFCICSLSQGWGTEKIETESSKNGQKLENPTWITGINATCLTCGLTSNLLLFVNLSSPFSYYAVQIFATVGGIISCIAFVILISVFAQERKYISPSDQFEFTQAFYYSVMAAALYFIVSVFLGINFLATRWHFFPKTFKLYETERKLLLQDTTLMFYLLLGALIFSLIEKWQFLDAVFWADFTLLTIGLGGEFTPKTSLGRVLLLPYVIGGIMILGMLISSLHDLLETAKKRLCNQMAESKRRLIQASFLGSHQEAGELSGGITSPAFICNEDFNALRKLKNNAARKTRWIALVVSALLILAFWLAGAAVFAAAEKSAQWTYPIALYFTYVSLLTLGYGDYIPSTNLGKSFYVLWTVIGVPVLTIFISNMADTMVQVLQNLLLVVGSFTILPNIEILNRIKKWCCSERRAFKGWNQVQKSSEITRSCQTKRGKEKAKLVPDCNRDRSPKILKDALFQVIMDCMVDPNKEYTYEQWLQFADLIFPDVNGRWFTPSTEFWFSKQSPLFSGSEPGWIARKLAHRLNHSEGDFSSNINMEN